MSSNMELVPVTSQKHDPAWKHCQMFKNGDRVQLKCVYCTKMFKGGGIHRIKEHLAGHKGNASTCLRVPPDVQQIMEESLKGVVAKKRKKQKLAEVISGFDPSTSEVDGLTGQCDLSGGVSLMPVGDGIDQNLSVLEDGLRKRGRKKRGVKKSAGNTSLDVIPLDVMGGKRVNDQVHLAIGRFFYDVGVPLDAVNSVYFQPMLDAIASQGAVSVAPSYHDLRSGILKNSVQEVRNDINLCMNHWGHSGCSVLVDEYISEKGKILINFMVYCSEGTIFLRFVDVTDIVNSEDALYELLKEVVEEVGVRNVLQVITNTEDRYVVAGKRLSDTFPTVFWTPCAARCVDLMLEDFGKLKWINSILEKSKYISRFIYNNSVVLNMMRRYTYGVDLVELGVSSSATDFATLKRLCTIKPNLQSMVTSEEWMECPYSKKAEGITMLDYISNQSFWSTCSFVTRLTDPLLRLLRIVSSERRPAMGYVNAGIYRAKETIKKEFEEKKEYEVYWNIIDCRWEQLQHHPLHAAGFYLNPKFFYSTEGSIHRHIPSSVFDCVEKMIPDPKIQDKIMKETTSYHNAAGDFGRNMAMRARETLLPAEWWSTYGGACPNLSHLALRVLSQTCSLMSCKPNRYYLEQIDKTKNCLEHQRLTDLVFVQYNLRLRQMAVKNREQDAADPISCDIINTSEDWVTENEVGLEDTGSADWMNVVPPLGNMTLLASEIEDIEALGAGFDDYEEVLNGVKDSEGENGEDRE